MNGYLLHFGFYKIRIIFAVLIGISSSVQASTYPEFNNPYINDIAGILSNSEKNTLRLDLEKINSNNEIQLTVVIIESRLFYGAHSVESFATGLFNYWQVGNALNNNGVLIVVSKEDREMRIELGNGYGDSRNVLMNRIIDDVMVPQFKKKNYFDGLEKGIEAIIVGLSDSVSTSKLESNVENDRDVYVYLIYIIVPVFIVLLFALWLKRYLRNRIWSCTKCKTKMRLIANNNEHKYLNEGQILEEAIKSVDYDVWQCTSCHHITLKRYTSWFSIYGACPECKYKTFESDSTVVSEATEHSTGEERFDYWCENCDYTKTEYQVIPRETESSNSSSSPGSSSSGGSSSGGGASGNW